MVSPSGRENSVRTSLVGGTGDPSPRNIASRAGTLNPAVAARIAGWKSSFQRSAPNLACAACSMAIAPGTPVERPLRTATTNGSGLPCSSRNMSGCAPAGARSRPSMALTLRVCPS